MKDPFIFLVIQVSKKCAHLMGLRRKCIFQLLTFKQLSVRVGMSLMVRDIIPVQLLAMFLKPWTEI